ncbi:Uncharacterised protein [Vibrio cholerae]|nr:Uncharacterised protein [Vibrio cholerae]
MLLLRFKFADGAQQLITLIARSRQGLFRVSIKRHLQMHRHKLVEAGVQTLQLLRIERSFGVLLNHVITLFT